MVTPQRFDVFKQENIVFDNEEHEHEDIIMDVYEAPKDELPAPIEDENVNFETNSQDLQIQEIELEK